MSEPLEGSEKSTPPGAKPTYEELLARVAQLEKQEQELRRSEALLRAAVDAAPDAENALHATLQRFYAVLSSMYSAVLLMTDEGRVEFANPAFCDRFGLGVAPADLVGLTARDMIGRIKNAFLDPDHALARIQEIVDRGEPVHGEELALRGGGTWLRDFIPLSAGGKPNGRLWLHFDITDRKRAEAALREAHATTAAVLESIADAFYSLDEQWRFVVVNPAAERAPFGQPASALRGKVIWDVFPNIVGTRIHQHYLDAMEKGSPEHYEALSPLNGRWYEVFMFRRAAGLDVYLRDIDDRKRAQEALQESERRFTLALKNSPVSLTAQDRDLRILWRYNPRATGSAYDDLGKTEADLYPPEEAEKVMALKRRVLETGSEGRGQFWLTAHGERFFLDLSVEPTRDADGRIVGVTTAAVDLTESKRLEEELREGDQRKNEFLAVLSHELRNPLAPIKNNLYILEHAVPGGEQARRAQTVIDRQAGHLARLVDDLLDVTRISRNKIQLHCERLELNELVQQAMEDQRSLFDKGEVHLAFHPAPEPVFVNGDWRRLAQVVGNLLQNAAKFTGWGGTTRVTVSTDPVERRAVIRVIDSGVGMSPEIVSRLFQPFTQADSSLDRSKGGLGLGLALVKGLIDLHDGEVTAGSAGLGKGAEFTVRLPRLPEEIARPELWFTFLRRPIRPIHTARQSPGLAAIKRTDVLCRERPALTLSS